MLFKMALLRLRHVFRKTHANVRAAYDIGLDFYDAFLDETHGYSCGYQITPSDTSRELQDNKYDRICQKLQLKSGETLFDIGCGCGGLLIHAAMHYGAIGRGIVISRDHFEFAKKRIQELGLKGRIKIELGDFRSIKGTYDKVTSVGVFEHLFAREHSDFMEIHKRLLKPGGYTLLHTLGCVTPNNDHDPFIQKYIFPGSRQNPLSRISSAAEKAGLAILDVENLKPHYAPTVDRWMERFREQRSNLDPRRYNERFCRMWEYYLALCVAATRFSDGAVFQVLMTNSYRRPLRLHRV
jgi:cyclopropane-fatty-acyl-phospholipid synthase